MQELHLVHKLSQKMTIGFRRPLGSNADVRELEYISVLCQTDMSGVRVDGSIQGACTSSLPSFALIVSTDTTLTFKTVSFVRGRHCLLFAILLRH